MNTIFSIIIPVYNVEDYLEECIKSVLSQDFSDYEIILVDDGSTDNSGNICDNYRNNYEKIKVIHKENGGSSSARNEGIKKAVGRYILFLDSDDFYCDKSFLSKAFEISKTDFDCLWFKTAYFYSDEERYEDHYGDYDLSIFSGSMHNIFMRMLEQKMQLASPCNKVIKRELFLENNLYFEEGIIAEDVEWVIRLFEATSKMCAINKVAYAYRKNRIGAVTYKTTHKKLNDIITVIKRIICASNTVNKLNKLDLLSYAAFEYAVLLVNVASMKDYKAFPEVKKYAYLLKYALDRKTKIVKIIYSLFGYNNTIKIIRMIR